MLTLLFEYHTWRKAQFVLLHSLFLQVRVLTHKFSWVEYHTKRFDIIKTTHMIELSISDVTHYTFLPIQISHSCFNFFIRANSSFKTTKLTAVSTCRLVANTSFTSCPKSCILAATAEAYFTLTSADPNNWFLAISRPIYKMLSVSA
jgi:hypothetical protein